MNTFKKFCPNVWVAECDEQYSKGDIIALETKNGKKVECKVYNFIKERGGKWYYSIVRCEEERYAERRAKMWEGRQLRASAKSTEYYNKSNENGEFLGKSDEYMQKAEDAEHRAKYWKDKAKEVTLAMPESIRYFERKLKKAIELQRQYKSGEREWEHAFSLPYATKAVKELTEKVRIAKLLWAK